MPTQSDDRFARRCRAYYLGVVAFGSLLLVLFPVWRGQGYLDMDRLPDGTSRWVKWGSFGLTGVVAATNQAPLWDPPQAYSGAAHPVRWPWQSPTSSAVEIDLFIQATLLSALVACCGVALRLAYRFAGRRPDGFVWSAWSTAAGLVLTGATVWLALLLTLGGLMEDYESWLIAGTIAGGPLGYWYGVASQRRTAAEAGTETTLPLRSQSNALWRFTIGALSGVAVWCIVIHLADGFRGPISGVNEFGFPRYVRNQLPVNFAAGAVICVAGWTLAGIGRRCLKTSSFSIGVVLSSTALGIATWFW